MIEDEIISVDIGSTWTKAARFVVHNDRFEVIKRSVVPTSSDFLPDGFFSVLSQLDPKLDWSKTDAKRPGVFLSSSAKGGLKVAVVGLVPEMSLHIARLAAFSAGARICGAFPYRLISSYINEIERIQPDIILLCGGTDGGNERYVKENARALAASSFDGVIVYAGNCQAVDDISELLAKKELVLCENLMPDFGRLNLEPTRSAIREIFLDRIVSGKGLDQLVRQFKLAPVPTPLAVLNLVEAVGKYCQGWQNIAAIDMGGATTDFYSYTEAFHPDSGNFLKGIVEPRLKRTVEGDLGMRVSAASVFELAETWFEAELKSSGATLDQMRDYVGKLEQNHSYLPEEIQGREALFDNLLARACINNALVRHAGFVEEVFTTSGPIQAQHGKDLRKIDKIIGSGGYLAAQTDNKNSFSFSTAGQVDARRNSLIPEKYAYFVDAEYLWPLLGNLAGQFPRQAAHIAVSVLKEQVVARRIEMDKGYEFNSLGGSCTSNYTQGAQSS